MRFGAGVEEEAVDLEILHHLEMRIDELIEQGCDPAEAKRLAHDAFGDLVRYRRECVVERKRGVRMMWWREMVGTVVGDARYALRGIRRAPGFAMAIVATLALGIGANTAIFTVISATILKPVDFAEPDELYMVHARYVEQDFLYSWVNAEGARAWAGEDTPFRSIGFNARVRVTARVGEALETVGTQGIAPGLTDMLGVTPMLGRPFTVADSEPGAEPVVIIGESYWSRALGRRPDVLGTSIDLDGTTYRIVGVMGRRFRYPTFSVNELWVPMKEDWTVAGQAMSQIQVTVRIPEDEYEATLARAEAFASNIQEVVGAVGLMLLIALVNCTNLTLARGTTRARELGVRLALGGSGSRVAAQLFVESFILALIAGAAAVAVAYVGVQGLVAIAPRDFTAFASRPIEVDGPVLAFAGGLTVVVGLFFGLMPAAFSVRKTDATSASAIGSHGGASRAYHRFRGTLVVAQVALSLVVLFGAALLGRSFNRLVSVDPGFEVENLIELGLSLSPTTYASPEARAHFAGELTERIRDLGGVTSAMYSVGVPPGAGITFGDALWVEGSSEPIQEGDVYIPFTEGRTGYAELLGVELLAGRFPAADDDPAVRGVVVDEDLARALGGVSESVGKRFGFDEERGYHVLGVIRDLKVMGLDDRFGTYAMVTQFGGERLGTYFTVAIRTDMDPEALFGSIRDVVTGMNADQPIQQLRTIADSYAESVARPRFFLTVMTTFAGLAVLLACIGLYGVLNFAVMQRTREMGIRLALGARAEDVRGLVMRGGIGMAALGVALGLVGAYWSSTVLEALLFDTSARDMVALGGAAVVMLGVAALASWLPAWRATRVDPAGALKAE
jgi:ABC-type antimicrobial peptide transport system permease subunit